jgi:histidinol-phosphate aminotransferase
MSPVAQVTFIERLQRIPLYSAGADSAEAAARETSSVAMLASNESPFPPVPAVVEAVQRAAAEVNRYPDPGAGALRRALSDRYEYPAAGIAVGNGSCEILLAAAEALLEASSELVYAWPSFSMYPHLAAATDAKERQVALTDDYVHDLDAMADRINDLTRMVLVCNPNNPTGTFLSSEQIGAFLERVPPSVLVILDEAYIEFETVEDPDTSLGLLRDFQNLVLLRTFSKAYGLAGLRVGYALCAPSFRSAVDAVRQPFSVNAIAQAAAAEAILHQDHVTRQVERNVVERVTVEEGVRELGLSTPDSHANFSWISLGDRDEAAILAALEREGVLVRPGTPLGGPGHIRVSYGHPPQNRRFLEALGAAL